MNLTDILETVVVTDSEGVQHKLYIEEVFDFNGQTYVLAAKDPNSEDSVLLKMVDGQVIHIQDSDEFTKAVAHMETLFAAA